MVTATNVLEDPRLLCLDCGINTMREAHEYYMLNHELWAEIAPDIEGMMCIGCVEERLGRQLVLDDFLLCPLNCMIDAGEWRRATSERLLDRLHGMADVPWPD